MSTEQQENGSASDTQDQEQQGQQQQTTDDTSGNGSQQQAAPEATPVITKDTVIPDDHPLVKQLKDDKAKLSKANTELAELRAKSKKVTDLETELGARPTTEALETLQTRYDRLEAFLLAAGGPISKALDSRTFTKDLFESDKDIEDLVKDWKKANPSATSTALGSAAAGDTGGKKHDPNELIRAAWANGAKS